MCKECQESFYGKDCFDVHASCELQSPEFECEFDWVVPISGLLHLEMNAAKAFLSFNWSIFLERVMQELGITSKIGLTCAKKGSDHHELWDSLEIIYLGIINELLLPFVQHSFKKNEPISLSAENYWEYYKNAFNKTYSY